MLQVSKRMRFYEPHIVSVAASGYPAYEHTGGVHFHRISIGKLYGRVFRKWLRVDPFSYAVRVAKILRHISPVIVHSHNAHELLQDVAHRLPFRPRCISHLHNEFPITSTGNVDLVVTCSEYLKGLYAPRLQSRIGIQTLYNGADTRRFRECANDRDAQASLRMQLGIPASGKVILFVGRIVPEKGPHLLLEAFNLLMNAGSEGYLVLVGEIREEGKGAADRRYEYGRSILSRCRELGDRVKVVGVVDPETVPVYYSIGDVAVAPSVFEEPFGMVVVEAMAAGVPVIASNKGGIPECLTHGVNGLLLDDNRPVEDLAQKLGLLLSDGELAERLGRAGRKSVEERFTWEKIAAETEQVYDAVLAREPWEARA
jgi:glycosyltransferase involved in cell wall biosynthesis